MTQCHQTPAIAGTTSMVTHAVHACWLFTLREHLKFMNIFVDGLFMNG